MKRTLVIASAISLACFFSLAFYSCATTSASQNVSAGGSFSPDSVIGIWKFADSDHTLSFSKDFTMIHRDGENGQVDYGTWKILSTVNKTIQLTWALSENVDTLTLSANGRGISGTDDVGNAISCTR